MAAKQATAKAIKCLVPGCDNPAIWRGLCKSCYAAAAHKIRQAKEAGESFNWATLEAKGLALPRNNRRATAMSKELAKH